MKGSTAIPSADIENMQATLAGGAAQTPAPPDNIRSNMAAQTTHPTLCTHTHILGDILNAVRGMIAGLPGIQSDLVSLHGRLTRINAQYQSMVSGSCWTRIGSYSV